MSLCKACQQLLTTVKGSPPGSWRGEKPYLFEYPLRQDTWGGCHHFEWYSFRTAVEAGCYVCRTISRDCSVELRKQAHLFRTFYQLRVDEAIATQGPCPEHYTLGFTVEIMQGIPPISEQQVFECSGVFKILPKRDIGVPTEALNLTESTWSPKCENQIRKWLEGCTSSHQLCNQDWRTKGSYPARLLSVKPTADEEQSDYIRLVTYEDATQLPRYVTLSHCWGAGMTIKFQRSTKNLLEHGLPLAELPTRFRDAVKIARWMNVDYIWIDALCILQDSAQDWGIQSARMGDIYTNSYCNIAATSGSSDRGCFTKRSVPLVEPYSIPNPRSGQMIDTHVIGYDDFWSNSLLDTALHTRGWVLQERLLSPRTIHFGQEQIFWECRCEMACEAYPTGIPNQFRNRRTRSWRQSDEMLNPKKRNMTMALLQRQGLLERIVSWFSRLTLWSSSMIGTEDFTYAYKVWSTTIEHYMQCELSVPQDKLVAVSGIAQKVADATHERYLAGLWENDQLAPSLLWYVPARRKADSSASFRFPSSQNPNYRAPSWSWASLEAKVTWNWPVQCDRFLIDISDTIIEPVSGSEMGRVQSAMMHMKAHLVEATLEILNTDAEGNPEEDGQYSLHLKSKLGEKPDCVPVSTPAAILEPIMYLDAPLLPGPNSIRTFLLPVCTGWRGRSGNTITRLAGLLVKEVASFQSNATYERIGIFALNQTEVLKLCGAPEDDGKYVEGILAAKSKRSITLI